MIFHRRRGIIEAILFVVLLNGCFGVGAVHAAPLNAADDAALVAFYNATGGATWTNNTGWSGTAGVMTDGTGVGETAPFGVAFNGANQVTGINLFFNNLAGSPWTGATPLDLSTMPALASLALSGNQLSGDLPAPALLRAGLWTLDLSSNQLTTSVAGFPDYSLLTGLQTLSLRSNLLTGDLPAPALLPANLGYLDLSSNRLTTPVTGFPNYGATLTALSSLILSYNQLTGELPAPILIPAGLAYLDLSSNRLTMPVAGFPDYSLLTRLLDLYLDHNLLTGDLPSPARLPAGLWTLDLSSNQLTTPVAGFPDYGATQSGLISLILSLNQLTGELPAPALLPASLTSLELMGNQLTTPVTGFPDYGATLTALNSLILAYNRLTGELPAPALLPASLWILDLSNNQLTTLATGFPDYGTAITGLIAQYLDLNQILGPEPASFTAWMAVGGHSGRISTVPSIDAPAAGAALANASAVISGSHAEPNASVEVRLLDASGIVVDTQTTAADAAGAWRLTLSTTVFSPGNYSLQAQTHHWWSGYRNVTTGGWSTPPVAVVVTGAATPLAAGSGGGCLLAGSDTSQVSVYMIILALMLAGIGWMRRKNL